MNDHLIKILVDVIIFLEFSDDDIIDPDAAIQMIEHITAEICIMGAAEKKECVAQINKIADQHTGKHKDFIKHLPVILGIVEQ